MKTAVKQQNKNKIRRRKGIPKVPPPKELRAVHIGQLIANSEPRMKGTTCLHLQPPLTERGVEHANEKLKILFSGSGI